MDYRFDWSTPWCLYSEAVPVSPGLRKCRFLAARSSWLGCQIHPQKENGIHSGIGVLTPDLYWSGLSGLVGCPAASPYSPPQRSFWSSPNPRCLWLFDFPPPGIPWKRLLYPFGLCLDFSKCFDSCDAALCVLSSFGITVSGVYVTCCSMGQSFAVGLLWGCRLVSSHLCSVRPAARRPLVTVHADAVLASAAALSASYRAWHACASVSGWSYHLSFVAFLAACCWGVGTPSVVLRVVAPTRFKTQVWARTIPAFVAFENAGWSPSFLVDVLGVSVGGCGRASSDDESKRFCKCQRLARRLAALPCSHQFKASVASLVLSPVVSWGALLGGHVPTVSQVSGLPKSVRQG